MLIYAVITESSLASCCKGLEEKHNSITLSSDVLHGHKQHLLKKWNIVTMKVIQHPCYMADELVLCSYDKKLLKLALALQYADVCGSS